jgi:hypothetical protein
MINWFKTAITSCSLLCLSFIINQPAFAASDASKSVNKEIQQLEAKFRSLSSAFYRDKSSFTEESRSNSPGIDQLLISVNALIASKQPISAIQLINTNLKLVNENLDSEAIFSFLELLLDNNEWKLANSLFTTIKDEGDVSLLATVQFIFAKYHAKRNEWKQVNQLLSGNFSELSEKNSSYAYLLNGIALQHLKKHRKAVDSYKKIKPTSKYYSFAQLNTSIANIRQGWWTDAKRNIRAQLKQSNKTNKDELTNRLYLILGYALLQREYYRDARDAFRHIGLKSRYTNRALLGIGLTATSQGDYFGGLNALTILKGKNTFDLSVDESYLLVPYVYEKLQQELTVSTSYTEAMNYYQRRMSKLDKISKQKTSFLNLEYNNETKYFIIDNNSFDYGRKYPESFINNFRHLHAFKKASHSGKIKKRISKLIKQYDSTYQKIITDLTEQRKAYLKSYLNQSRYGLARLYDSSKENSN